MIMKTLLSLCKTKQKNGGGPIVFVLFELLFPLCFCLVFWCCLCFPPDVHSLFSENSFEVLSGTGTNVSPLSDLSSHLAMERQLGSVQVESAWGSLSTGVTQILPLLLSFRG